MKITAPAELSPFNALYALVRGKGDDITIDTINKIFMMNVHLNRSRTTVFIHNITIPSGISLVVEVDFTHYPELEVSGYDEEYGFDAAKNALDIYVKTLSANRLDVGDRSDIDEIKSPILTN